MSFIVSSSVTPMKVYNSLKGAAIVGAAETIDVTYEVTSILSLSGTTGVAEYTVTPEGASLSGTGQIEFTYSGTGNPITEAEAALQTAMIA
jgi:hypothetical protein